MDFDRFTFGPLDEDEDDSDDLLDIDFEEVTRHSNDTEFFMLDEEDLEDLDDLDDEDDLDDMDDLNDEN